jgi:hypothetical protein
MPPLSLKGIFRAPVHALESERPVALRIRHQSYSNRSAKPEASRARGAPLRSGALRE